MHCAGTFLRAGAAKTAWHPGCRRLRAGCPMDLLLVAATLAFFAVSLAYVRACDGL
jgi:hypothetical protein